jgi:hypothetical protein
LLCVVWTSFSRAVSASLLERSSIFSWAWSLQGRRWQSGWKEIDWKLSTQHIQSGSRTPSGGSRPVRSSWLLLPFQEAPFNKSHLLSKTDYIQIDNIEYPA